MGAYTLFFVEQKGRTQLQVLGCCKLEMITITANISHINLARSSHYVCIVL